MRRNTNQKAALRTKPNFDSHSPVSFSVIQSYQKQRYYLSPVAPLRRYGISLSEWDGQDRTMNALYANMMQSAANAIQITTITTPAIRLTAVSRPSSRQLRAS